MLSCARLSLVAAQLPSKDHLWNVEPEDLNRLTVIERLTGEKVRYRTTAECSEESIQDEGEPVRGDATYYVHLHKAGGTTVCSLAMQNGEQLEPFARWHNCNHMGDGQNGAVHGWWPGYSKSCTEADGGHAPRLATSDTFHMVERWMDFDT